MNEPIATTSTIATTFTNFLQKDAEEQAAFLDAVRTKLRAARGAGQHPASDVLTEAELTALPPGEHLAILAARAKRARRAKR